MNHSDVLKRLSGKRPTWEGLLEVNAGADEAASLMRCSRRTALKQLKAAAQQSELRAVQQAQAQAASRDAIGTAAERSNWPAELIAIAERVEQDGAESVSPSERNRLLASLPRGIAVAR